MTTSIRPVPLQPTIAATNLRGVAPLRPAHVPYPATTIGAPEFSTTSPVTMPFLAQRQPMRAVRATTVTTWPITGTSLISTASVNWYQAVVRSGRRKCSGYGPTSQRTRERMLSLYGTAHFTVRAQWVLSVFGRYMTYSMNSVSICFFRDTNTAMSAHHQ